MEGFVKKCPYCGKVMEEGRIPPGRYSLRWKSTQGYRGALNYFLNFDKKDIILSSIWDNSYCTAYLCRDCGKIIIDV